MQLHRGVYGHRKRVCIIIIIIIINPLTARVVGVPQMILQPVFSIFPCSPLLSGTCRTPGLSIPWCCLPTPSFVRLVFFPLSLCLARRFWPDLMNGKHDHTLQFASLYDRHEIFVVSNWLLDLGTDFLVGNMVFVWDVSYLAVAPHFHGLYSLKLCKHYVILICHIFYVILNVIDSLTDNRWCQKEWQSTSLRVPLMKLNNLKEQTDSSPEWEGWLVS